MTEGELRDELSQLQVTVHMTEPGSARRSQMAQRIILIKRELRAFDATVPWRYPGDSDDEPTQPRLSAPPRPPTRR